MNNCTSVTYMIQEYKVRNAKQPGEIFFDD